METPDEWCRNKRTEIVEGDTPQRFPTDLLEGVSAIINLAGLSTEPAAEYRPEANQEINFKAAVELASLRKRKAFVGSSRRRLARIYDVRRRTP